MDVERDRTYRIFPFGEKSWNFHVLSTPKSLCIYIIIVICICLYLCLYDVYKICPSNSKLGSIFSKFYKVGMGQTGQNWYPLVNKLENGPVEIVDLPIKSSVIFHSFFVRLPEGSRGNIHVNPYEWAMFIHFPCESFTRG